MFSTTLYMLLVIQLVIGMTIQPYLIYKLKDNLKIYTVVEYASLLGRTVTEFCILKFIFSSNLKLEIQDIIIGGLDHLNLLQVAAITKRHCSYLRKCVLTLIVSDFDQLTSNPMQFVEFMRFRNQIVRYSFFVAFCSFALFPDYLQIISAATFDNHHQLYHHLSSHKLIYDIFSSLTFHIAIFAICLRCLTRTRKTDIEMRACSDANKSNIRPLLFTMITFMLVIVPSFIIELLTFPCDKTVYSVHADNSSCRIIYWISFGYEGLSGIVVMASLFVWFPRLRPTMAWLHEMKVTKNKRPKIK